MIGIMVCDEPVIYAGIFKKDGCIGNGRETPPCFSVVLFGKVLRFVDDEVAITIGEKTTTVSVISIRYKI